MVVLLGAVGCLAQAHEAGRCGEADQRFEVVGRGQGVGQAADLGGFRGTFRPPFLPAAGAGVAGRSVHSLASGACRPTGEGRR